MAKITIIQQIDNWTSFTLSNKPEVLCWLDNEDMHFVESGHFYSHKDHQTHYVRTNKDNKTVMLHALIIKAPEGLLHDHKNLVGTDNRKSNIRFVTRTESQLNRRPLRGHLGEKREFEGIILPAYLSVNQRRVGAEAGKYQIFYKKKCLTASRDRDYIKNYIQFFIKEHYHELIYV